MTANSPQITTVIPTYRRPQMLRRAIRSVLRQTYPNLRIAVFDNASGDETGAVVAELMREDARITYHCHAENIGMVNNFNYAFEQVETPYFSLLSDDDLLLPEFYETALAGFERHPDAVFSAGAFIGLSDKGGALLGGLMDRDGYFTPPEGLLAWRERSHPCITANLFRREVIDRYGLMNNVMSSDFDMELRIVAQAPYVVSSRPFVIIISHDSNCTRLAAPDAWWENYQTFLGTLDSIPTIPADVLKQVKQNLYDDYTQDLYRRALLSAIRGNMSYTQAFARSLREQYGQEKYAAKLELVQRLQERVWPLRLCSGAAYGVHRLIKEMRNRPIEKQYRGYLLGTGS